MAAALACSGADITAVEGDSDLRPGDTGAEVEAFHVRFTELGYFENSELRADYPLWTPVVGEGPADPAVFGPELEAAVRVLQARASLPVTGVIDGPTREFINEIRCGVPESGGLGPAWERSSADPGEDSIEKWALQEAPQFVIPHRTDFNVSYSVASVANMKTGAGTTWDQGDVETALATAFNRWVVKGANTLSGLTFTNQESGADIAITFVSFSALVPPMTAKADANGTRIRFNTDIDWPTANGGLGSDIVTVAAHEMGHVLGFGHSSVVPNGGGSATRPVMWAGEANATLKSDDLHALAASPYVTWQGVSGAAAEARDIGASTFGVDEYVWRVGTTVHADGYVVARNVGGSWQTPANAGGGVRIDMAGRTPWVVTSGGIARQRTGVTATNLDGTGWGNRGKCGTAGFKDIGANSIGIVWALGGTPTSSGDYRAYRYNGPGTASTDCSHWLSTNGFGRYIDVAGDGSPWVAQTDGSVWHLNGVSGNTPVGNGDWDYVPDVIARDIGIGSDAPVPSSNIWVTSQSSVGEDIYTFNYQAPIDVDGGGTSGGGDTLGLYRWYKNGINHGYAAFITVGRDSMPWAVASDGSIWARRP